MAGSGVNFAPSTIYGTHYPNPCNLNLAGLQVKVNSKVAHKFLQAAVKLRLVFRVSIEFCISLDRS